MKTSALDMAATTMSGGNQQKVVLAKWLPPSLSSSSSTSRPAASTSAPRPRSTDCSPSSPAGLAILMISSELPEVLGMADRVLVVCEGRITAELDRGEATPEPVMHAPPTEPTTATATRRRTA